MIILNDYVISLLVDNENCIRLSGLALASGKSMDDIRKIPVITENLIMKNGKEYLRLPEMKNNADTMETDKANAETIAKLECKIKELEDRNKILEERVLSYADRAFSFAENAIITVNQQQYLSAMTQKTERLPWYKRLFNKKGIDSNET